MTPIEISRAFFEEIWNRRNLDYADVLLAPDCTTRQLRSNAPETSTPRGPSELKAHVQEWLAGFPDMRARIQHAVACGDEVFTWVVMEGTHQHEWHGVAATNERVSIQCMVMHRIRNEKIVEDWVLTDALGFYRQLGMV
jgi:predicted ester cyclase